MLIGVCGVTGKQGGAVARYLLENNYQVRGLTRNVDSEKLNELVNLGMEARQADFDDSNSLQSVFEGCDAVFIMTNFWEHMNPTREFIQGKNLIDSAINSNIKHIIWSTLEDTRRFNDDIPYIGEYKVPHFDEKGNLNTYLESRCIESNTIYTNLYTSFFYENFLSTMKLQSNENGVYPLYIPMNDTLLPMVSMLDIAKMVRCIIEKPILGNIGVASQHLTCSKIAEILSETLERDVRHYYLPYDKYKQLGFPGAEDLGNMFEFKNVHNSRFCSLRNLTDIKLNFETTSFREWCLEHKDQLL